MIYAMTKLLAPLSLFLLPALAWPATSDPAPCLGALTSVRARAYENSWSGGSLPRMVKYKRPARDIGVWKRRDGTLLAVDGKIVQQIPAFAGEANGRTFMRDPAAVADRVLVPSVYRQVVLADGRRLELHRLGEKGQEAVLLRGQAEDEAALAYEEENADRKERVAYTLLAQHAERMERVCEETQTRFSEKSLGDQIGSLVAGIQRATDPSLERPRESDRVAAEKKYIDMDFEDIRAAKARQSLVAEWRKAFTGAAPERERPANILHPEATSFNEESTRELLKEASADFEKHMKMEELDAEDRAQLKACEGFLELPPEKAEAKKPNLLELGARSTLPIEYAMLMNFYRRLQAEQDERLKNPVGH